MYEVFEHTADVGLRVRAADLGELFAEAARGLFSLIVPDLASVRPKQELPFRLAGSEREYLLFDWLNLKVAFDYADYDGSLPRQGDDAENRFSVGLEPFLARFLQVRAFYRVSNGVESIPNHNQDLWILELHAFF